MNWPSALFFILAIALALWGAFVWRALDRTWLPGELKTAKIIFSEHTLRIEHPYRVSGRFDRAYQLQGGEIVPTEYKNHDQVRAYPSDVTQLALYGWLLRKNGHQTTPYGFVIVNDRKGKIRRAIRVALPDDAAAERAVARYLALIDGRAEPRKSAGRKCGSCGHRDKCWA